MYSSSQALPVSHTSIRGTTGGCWEHVPPGLGAGGLSPPYGVPRLPYQVPPSPHPHHYPLQHPQLHLHPLRLGP